MNASSRRGADDTSGPGGEQPVGTVLGEMLALGPRLASRTIAQIQASQRLVSIISCAGRSSADPVPEADADTTTEPVDVLDVIAERDRINEDPDGDRTEPSTLAAEASGAVPDEADLAIPGYDSLAASQVVPRLTTLDPDELTAIETYESANRNRRTILNRVRQLTSSVDETG